MKVALYARVSSGRQAAKDLSIPAQLRLMNEFAAQQGWLVVEEFKEPARSGTTADRPVLQTVLGRIQDGSLAVDAVLAHKLNRVARNFDDFAPMRRLLRTHGVRFIYVVERIEDTAAGRLFENVMASVSEFESANLSEEAKKGMRQKVLTGGWPHKAPRGYVNVKRSDLGGQPRCEVQPREGPLIATAFALFASGRLSLKSLSRALAAKGLVSKKGLPVAHSNLRRILSNPFYVGRIVWNGLNVQASHASLVDQDTFERVQMVLRQRSVMPRLRGPVSGFPLRGIAVCARCRGFLTAERHGRWSYYRCSRRAYRKEACDSRFIRADRAHQDIENALRGLQLTRERADRLERSAAKLLRERSTKTNVLRQATEEKLASESKIAANLTDLFLSGHLSAVDYQQKMSQQTEQRRRLASKVKSINADPTQTLDQLRETLGTAVAFYDIYCKTRGDRRAEFLKLIFQSVILGADGLVGFRVRPPFDRLQDSGSDCEQVEALCAA